jgi:methylmalonyl-CoA/ethylmalonyl-CoA epimerase
MIKGVEHIGIAVKDLDAAEKQFETLLGVSSYKREIVESEGVITSFFKIGNVKIELLAAVNENSTIAKFIDKRGEGIHHIAFATDNASTELEKLENSGFQLINKEVKAGADEMNIGFVHPKSIHGVLTELCSPKM